MTVLLVLFACFFTALMCFKMFTPFFQTRDAQLQFEILDEDLKEIEALTQQKAVYIHQLSEIEDDFQSSKLSEQDYKQLKKRYEREIIMTLRKLDEVHGGKGWEQRVLKEQEHHASKDASDPKEPITVTPSAPEVELTEPEKPSATLLCSSCAAPLSPDDKFCSQCATPVSTSTSTPLHVSKNEEVSP